MNHFIGEGMSKELANDARFSEISIPLEGYGGSLRLVLD